MTQTSGASRRGNANVYPKQALIRKCFHCLKIAFHRHHHCTPSFRGAALRRARNP